MADDAKPFHNPFASALEGLRGSMPASQAPEGPQPAAPPPALKGPARAVVRLERSGRGGKEVTVVEHLALPTAELERWLKAMKSGLGCGGVVEGASLVLQGDQRDRLPKLLAAKGVRRVTIG